MSRQDTARRALAALAAAAIVGAIAVLSGCAGTYTSISPETVRERLDSGEQVFLLDVRTQSEFDAGHIPGAVLIPVQQLKSRMAEVPGDRPIIVYCLTASRSAEAAAMLSAAGYKDVFDMAQGIQAWRGAIER